MSTATAIHSAPVPDEQQDGPGEVEDPQRGLKQRREGQNHHRTTEEAEFPDDAVLPPFSGEGPQRAIHRFITSKSARGALRLQGTGYL
jgi:hypothetical protein